MAIKAGRKGVNRTEVDELGKIKNGGGGGGGGEYVLPVATATTLGGVKVSEFSGLRITPQGEIIVAGGTFGNAEWDFTQSITSDTDVDAVLHGVERTENGLVFDANNDWVALGTYGMTRGKVMKLDIGNCNFDPPGSNYRTFFSFTNGASPADTYCPLLYRSTGWTTYLNGWGSPITGFEDVNSISNKKFTFWFDPAGTFHLYVDGVEHEEMRKTVNALYGQNLYLGFSSGSRGIPGATVKGFKVYISETTPY